MITVRVFDSAGQMFEAMTFDYTRIEAFAYGDLYAWKPPSGGRLEIQHIDCELNEVVHVD